MGTHGHSREPPSKSLEALIRLRLLVTGATGLIGRGVVTRALRGGHDVYSAWHKEMPEQGTPLYLDITDETSIAKAFETPFDAVIHLAAMTEVDRCETEIDSAYRLNAEATEGIARLSKAAGVRMIFVSTDYVFDGERGRYAETYRAHPVNVYGKSKLRGEESVQHLCEDWCIARTSTPFGLHPTKPVFAVMLAERLGVGEEFAAVTDQFTSPTYTMDLAQMLVEIAEREVSGLIHVSGCTRISRYEFALKLATRLGLDKTLIRPKLMKEIPWKAPRPKDSSLEVRRALSELRFKPRDLDDSLGSFAVEYDKLKTPRNKQRDN